MAKTSPADGEPPRDKKDAARPYHPADDDHSNMVTENRRGEERKRPTSGHHHGKEESVLCSP